MKKQILTKFALSGAAAAMLLGSGAATALAENSVGARLKATVNVRAESTDDDNVKATTSARADLRVTNVRANAKAEAEAKMEDKAKSRASEEIERRTNLLGDLSERIKGMVRISGDDKSALSSMLQTQIDALIALKAKIAAETSTTSLKEDIKSITNSYRIFALVMPKASITAYADRLHVLVSQMTTLGTKLQTRIDAAKAGGADVSAATTAMADYNAKVADAQVQITAAVNEITPLQPDNGDATIAASNKVALQDARTKLEAARKDLETARKDVEKVRKALPKVEEHATTTTSTQSQ